MKLDQKLVDAAIAFAEWRFPGKPYEAATAIYTDEGDILLSAALELPNSSVGLCHEAGAICEAYAKKRGFLPQLAWRLRTVCF